MTHYCDINNSAVKIALFDLDHSFKRYYCIYQNFIILFIKVLITFRFNLTQGCAFISLLNFNLKTAFSQEYLIIIFYDKNIMVKIKVVCKITRSHLCELYFCNKSRVPDPDPTSQKPRFRSG